MGLHWGDEDEKPLPDWVYVLLAIACIIGLAYGAAK